MSEVSSIYKQIKGKCLIKCSKLCKAKVLIVLKNKLNKIRNLGLSRNLEGIRRWCKGTLKDVIKRINRIRSQEWILVIEGLICISLPSSNIKMEHWMWLKRGWGRLRTREMTFGECPWIQKRSQNRKKASRKFKRCVRPIANMQRVRSIERVRVVLASWIWNRRREEGGEEIINLYNGVFTN